MTEITEHTADWILVDGTCGLCRLGATRWHRHLRHLGFRLGTLQRAQATGRIGSEQDAMCVIDHRDQVQHFGADGLLHILRRHPGLWVFGYLLTAPGFLHLVRLGYRLVAHHRHHLGCAIQPKE